MGTTIGFCEAEETMLDRRLNGRDIEIMLQGKER